MLQSFGRLTWKLTRLVVSFTVEKARL